MFAIYIGIDDTDSVKGMCTTFLLTEVMREFGELDIIGYPRLVRLNPTIPWKTRGNAALSVRFGTGSGRKKQIGCIGIKKYYAYEKADEKRSDGGLDVEYFTARLDALFERYAMIDDEKTNPAFVLSQKRLPEEWYWQAVRSVVRIDDVVRKLRERGVYFRTYKNGRGVIGASAAISWTPSAGRMTYEIIAYRHKEKWGTCRNIRHESVKEMDAAFPETFNNYDYANRHICIAPKTPCPVLFGIRSVSHDRLFEASEAIDAGEDIERKFIFETNQGTDDHIQEMKIADIAEHSCAAVAGTVCDAPQTYQGGHTVFRIRDETGTADCAAYEPGKQFRNVVRQLMPGDKIQVWAAVRCSDRRIPTLNLEKLNVLQLAEIRRKTANPQCQKCGKSMKSTGGGRNSGYKCIKCGSRAAIDSAEFAPVRRTLKPGLYEPPPSSMRHLSRPIKLMIDST